MQKEESGQRRHYIGNDDCMFLLTDEYDSEALSKNN